MLWIAIDSCTLALYSVYSYNSSSFRTAFASSQQVRRLRGNPQVESAINILAGHDSARKLSTAPKCGTPDPTCTSTNLGKTYQPTSTSGAIVVDGDISDWNPHMSCAGIPMFRAGNPACGIGPECQNTGSNGEYALDAWVDYDCSSSTLCVLVKAQSGFELKDNFEFSYTGYNGKQYGTAIMDVSNNIIAWEGCFDLAFGCVKGVQFHANYSPLDAGESQTGSTGKPSRNSDDTIALDLSCPCAADEECQVNACYNGSTCGADGQVCFLIVLSCALSPFDLTIANTHIRPCSLVPV